MFGTPDILHPRIIHSSRFGLDMRHVFLPSVEKRDIMKGEVEKGILMTLPYMWPHVGQL